MFTYDQIELFSSQSFENISTDKIMYGKAKSRSQIGNRSNSNYTDQIFLENFLYSDKLQVVGTPVSSSGEIKSRKISLFGSRLKNLYTEHLSSNEHFIDSYVPVPLDLAIREDIKFLNIDTPFFLQESDYHEIPLVSNDSIPVFFGEPFRGPLSGVTDSIIMDNWVSSPYPFQKSYEQASRWFKQTYTTTENTPLSYNISDAQPTSNVSSSKVGPIFYNVAQEVTGAFATYPVYQFQSSDYNLIDSIYTPSFGGSSHPPVFCGSLSKSSISSTSDVLYTAVGDRVYRWSTLIDEKQNANITYRGITVANEAWSGLFPYIRNNIYAVGDNDGYPYITRINSSLASDHTMSEAGVMNDVESYYMEQTETNKREPIGVFAVGHREDSGSPGKILASVWGAVRNDEPGNFSLLSLSGGGADTVLEYKSLRAVSNIVNAQFSNGLYIAVGEYNVGGQSDTDAGIVMFFRASGATDRLMYVYDPAFNYIHFYCVETNGNIAILAGKDENPGFNGTKIVKIEVINSSAVPPTITATTITSAEKSAGLKYDGIYSGITLLDGEFYLFGEDNMVQKVSSSTNWEMVNVSHEFTGGGPSGDFLSVMPKPTSGSLGERRVAKDSYILSKDNLIFANSDISTEYETDKIFSTPLGGGTLEPNTYFTTATIKNSLRAFYGFGKGYTINFDGTLISKPQGEFTILPNKGVGYRDYKVTALNPVETVRLIGPIPHGFSYGVMNVTPTPSKCIFRRNHYGHFRDMLEQRPMAKYYSKSEGSDASSQVPVVRVHILEDTREGELIKEYMAATEPVEFNWYDSGIYDVEYRAGQPFFDYRDI